MKRCSQCGNDVPDSSKTICSQCEAFANELEFADAPSDFEGGFEFDEPLDEPVSAETPAMAAAAAPAATAAPVATAPASAPAAATAAKPARPANRRMVLAGLLVVLGGTLTFAMFRPAPAVPVPVPAPKPAARKPAAKPPAQNTAAPAANAAPAPAPTMTPAPAATTPTASAATPTAPAAAAPVATPAPKPTAAPAPVVATAPAPAPKPAATPAAAPVAAPVAAPAAAPAAAPVSVVPSKWSAANTEWLVSAKKGVAFQLRSEKKVVIWQGVAHPTLVVRCDAGKMQMFVYTATALQMEAQDDNHTVRVTVDGDAELTERWADSADHDALFVPDPTAFARRLTTANNLRVSYTPHNAARVQADFQVAGLGNVLQSTVKQCGWK